MATTLGTIPTHIFLPSASQQFVADMPYAGKYLLGISAEPCSPEVQEELRLREPYSTFNSLEAAAENLISRIEWAWACARTAAGLAAVLDGVSEILASQASLLAVRSTRSRIVDIRERVALAVERKGAGQPQPKHFVHDDPAARRIAELEAAVEALTRTVANLQQQLNASLLASAPAAPTPIVVEQDASARDALMAELRRMNATPLNGAL